jgi:hypothetical protein
VHTSAVSRALAKRWSKQNEGKSNMSRFNIGSGLFVMLLTLSQPTQTPPALIAPKLQASLRNRFAQILHSVVWMSR